MCSLGSSSSRANELLVCKMYSTNIFSEDVCVDELVLFSVLEVVVVLLHETMLEVCEAVI